MDSGSEGQAWVENLCHHFSTFCSEADEIICQDSVKYVRTQLITAGENLLHLCSELIEDVLPDFSADPAGENGLASPAQEQNVNFPAQKMLSIGIVSDQDRKSCTVDSASSLSSIVPLGERCINIQSDGKVCTCKFSTIESHQPSGCQKLEESIIMVNNDECYSDSDMETNYLSLENTTVKLCNLNEKTANERSSESISQERDQMTEKCCTELPGAKDSRMVNEYFCDSDWEII